MTDTANLRGETAATPFHYRAALTFAVPAKASGGTAKTLIFQ